MKTTRRRFVATSALAGAGALLTRARVFGRQGAVSASWPPYLRKFVAPLPGIGPTGIPVAAPNTTMYPGTDYYRIVMGQYEQQLHPDLAPTTLWGYADATTGLPSFRYAGPAIVAKKNSPVRVNFINRLPGIHPLPVDTSIPGAETGQLVNRAAVHLHGGFVPWPSDGGPFHWIAPDGTHGPSVVKWLPDRAGNLTDDYWYPNRQSARLMWYHDHAVGLTRLNAYAGLAAPFVIWDEFEDWMFGASGVILKDQLPGIPLVLQDKTFKIADDEWGKVGDLWYPSVGEQDPEYPGTPLTLPSPSCVPEFFAEHIVINGMAFPELTVPQGVHRLRMLNGAQSRVFNLQLYAEDELHPGEADLSVKGPDFIQIGTEAGFLPAPAVVPSGNRFDIAKYQRHDTTGYSLILAGAERADVLVDFTGCAGRNFILYNDAPGPFYSGPPETDYFTGAVDGTGNPASGPLGYGPNTRTMMRIKVTDGATPGLKGRALLTALKAVFLNPALNPLLVPDALISLGEPVLGKALKLLRPVRRNMTLNEGWDEYGRLIQLLGTDQGTGFAFTNYGQPYLAPIDPVRESHNVGDVEIWDVYNATADVHPIHFHLVTVQVLGRAPFVQNPDGTVMFVPGTFVPPDRNERGWKETVRMNPGEVTRVIMKLELPPEPVVRVSGVNRRVPVPTSPRTGGYEYVWHCHILEHEEHDMMRPFVVFP
jgi:spore coat protein A, manganese oxidase